jgi:hypothetical protein
MMSRKEVIRWLETLTSPYVAVDDGGLTLVPVGDPEEEGHAYCEIGGVPLPEDREL